MDYPRISKKLLHYHLDRIDVTMGQEVQEGDLLGCVGETGNASEVHLHLGMQPSEVGPYEDPHTYEYHYPTATMSSDATVYGGPSTTLYAPIGSVIKNGKIEVLNRENDFFHIRYWTNKGLLKRGYVAVSQVSNSPSISVIDVANTFKGNNGVVYPQSAVYSNPNMTTETIGTVFEFESVTQFTIQENGFHFIEYSTPTGTKRGYVQSSELIQKEGGLAVAPYGAEVYYTPRFEYKAGGVYADEYVAVIQSSGTTSYIEYNTEGGRKRGYVTSGSLHFLDTGDVPALPNYSEEFNKSISALTVYFGPSDKYAQSESINEGEIVTRMASPALNTNAFSFIQYSTADGFKRGYVNTSGLMPYTPPVIEPVEPGEPLNQAIRRSLSL